MFHTLDMQWPTGLDASLDSEIESVSLDPIGF